MLSGDREYYYFISEIAATLFVGMSVAVAGVMYL